MPNADTPWTTWLPQAFAGELSPTEQLPLLAQLVPHNLPPEALTPLLTELWQWLYQQLPVISELDTFTPRLDTCGTGGSGLCHYNTSTTVALLLASMGHSVTKFGNRAATSQTGSFDFLGGLGLGNPLPLERVGEALAETQLALVYAPQCLPGLAHLAAARKQLGQRTVFNLLGPLLNPCRPTHQLLGHAGLPEPVIQAMAQMLAANHVQAWLASGHAGQDDITPWGQSLVRSTDPAACQDFWLDGHAPMPSQPWADDTQSNVHTFWAIAQGQDTHSPAYQLVCINAAACLALLQGLTPNHIIELQPLVKAHLSTGQLASHTRHVTQIYAKLTV